MPVSLPEGEVGVSVSFRTISLPFEAIRAEYLSRTQWLRKGRPSCPFCTRYKLAPWPKTYDRYIYIYTMLEPRRQAMALFPTEYYANGWPEGGLAICLEVSFFGKVDSKVAHNTNASICNA